MTVRYRAWHKTWEEMGEVKRIRFDDDGNVSTVLFVGKDFGENAKIDEIVIMQSTGLLDKNGKEIFEGDILGTKDGLLNGVVEYRSDLGMWTNSLIRYNNFERLCTVANSREIIGNIYENKDILEEKNEPRNN